MSEITNLRQARKAKERREKEAEATANRARFGVSKAEKQRVKAQHALDQRHLDAHKRSE